ncbi:Prolyl Hydroxylase Egln2 [Manis pentadactyla]|nr:Prolyl Hydroxylase Egln2 [Manis pentadactyla]
MATPRLDPPSISLVPSAPRRPLPFGCPPLPAGPAPLLGPSESRSRRAVPAHLPCAPNRPPGRGAGEGHPAATRTPASLCPLRPRHSHLRTFGVHGRSEPPGASSPAHLTRMETLGCREFLPAFPHLCPPLSPRGPVGGGRGSSGGRHPPNLEVFHFLAPPH